MSKGGQAGEAEGPAGFDVAAFDRFEAGAEVLDVVGATPQKQGQPADGEAVQLQPGFG